MNTFKVLIYKLIVVLSYMLSFQFRKQRSIKSFTIGFITEEFFHPELRGLGGLGKTVKNIAQYFNQRKDNFRSKVLLTEAMVKYPTAQKAIFHDTDVLFRPLGSKFQFKKTLKYISLLHAFRIQCFVSVDYYPSYEYPLFAAPAVPLIIWIHDPRDREEWEKIATCSAMMAVRKKNNIQEMFQLAAEKEESLKQIIKLSRQQLKRKIIFATQAQSLVEKARRTYGLPDLKPYLLHNPMDVPVFDKITYSERPSLCFLGRLDTVKRPQIAFELAKRFENIDFYIAGATHEKQLMDPIIESYQNIRNLKFLGVIDGVEKDQVLKNCWGIVNTSIHEALPVSFLEAFSYGKTVISCHDPDELVTKFGYFTGEILGDGLDEKSLQLFSETIKDFLSNDTQRIKKGALARDYIKEHYSFENFEHQLEIILSSEGVL